MKPELYYQKLAERLSEKHTPEEVAEMIAFLQESAQDSEYSEEVYLNGLGTPDETAAILSGDGLESADGFAAEKENHDHHYSLPPLPSAERQESQSEWQNTVYDGYSLVDPALLQSISRIRIDLEKADLTVCSGENPGLWCLEGENSLKVSVTDGILKISSGPKNSLWNLIRFPMEKTDLHLVLPAEVLCEKISVSTVSGTCEFSSLQARKLAVEGVSTQVRVQDCQLQKLKVSSVKGSLLTEDSSIEKISADGVSSTVQIERTQFLQADFSSVSGTTEVELPDNLPCRAATVTGPIYADSDLASSLVREIPGWKLEFTPLYCEGKGLRAESVSGSIQVSRKKF